MSRRTVLVTGGSMGIGRAVAEALAADGARLILVAHGRDALEDVLTAVHHCLPALRSSRGAIVTFSGGGGTGPLARYDDYATSKAAVVRLTENLAVELAQTGIRVNAVAPGFVVTRMHESTLQAGEDTVGVDYFARTQRGLASGGVPATQAASLVRLLLDPATEPFTGKLLSAQWDPWREPAFRARLEAERDLATLRRIDDQFYTAAAR